MKYKAVIFDLDGTLVYTEPEYRYKIIGETLKELGVDYFSKKNIDKFWFETKRDEIIEKEFSLVPETFWKIYQKKESVEIRRRFVKLYRDVDFILRLRQTGYKTGIVTGSPDNIADFEIGMIGKSNFDSIVIARHFTEIGPKPDPRGLEKCLDYLGVGKSDSMYIGNAEEDILTAKNAGITDVFLERGEYGFKLDEMKPSHVINSLYELSGLLV